MTQEAERFIEVLRQGGVVVKTAWEAWSSIEASRYDPKGQGSDSGAAAIILQRYLDGLH